MSTTRLHPQGTVTGIDLDQRLGECTLDAKAATGPDPRWLRYRLSKPAGIGLRDRIAARSLATAR